MSATYAIYTSPNHQPVPDHLPTLIVTPHGKPHHLLYTYLHTNSNMENYLLTPSDQGDLCVAKLVPHHHLKNNSNPSSSSSSVASSSSSSTKNPANTANPINPNSNSNHSFIRCEASRNLRWTIRNEGIQNPIYKLTLPNPENPQVEQPLFQISKPNPNSPWWTLFYFTYAGHLIPPKRIEFGKIIKSQPVAHPSGKSLASQGETKISVTGKTDEERAVWKTLGEGNEDMVEWVILCAALNVLDDEITRAAAAAGVKVHSRLNQPRTNPRAVNGPHIHPTGKTGHRDVKSQPIRPAVYQNARAAPPSSQSGPGAVVTPIRTHPPPGLTQAPVPAAHHNRTQPLAPSSAPRGGYPPPGLGQAPVPAAHQSRAQPVLSPAPHGLPPPPRQGQPNPPRPANRTLPTAYPHPPAGRASHEQQRSHPLPPLSQNGNLNRGHTIGSPRGSQQYGHNPASRVPQMGGLDIFSEPADLAYARGGTPPPGANLYPSASLPAKKAPQAGLRAMAQQAGSPSSQALTPQALYHHQQQSQSSRGRQHPAPPGAPASVAGYSNRDHYQNQVPPSSGSVAGYPSRDDNSSYNKHPVAASVNGYSSRDNYQPNRLRKVRS